MIKLFFLNLTFLSFIVIFGAVGCSAQNAENNNGEYSEWFNNGQLKAKGSILHNKKDGLWQEYYKNGKLKAEKHFKKGILNGTYKTWFEDGTLSEKSNFVEGAYDGALVTFYPDGNAKDSTMYDNGLKNGFSYKWYENAQLSSKELFDEGRLEVAKSEYWNICLDKPLSPSFFEKENKQKLFENASSVDPLDKGKELLKAVGDDLEKYEYDVFWGELVHKKDDETVIKQYGEKLDIADVTKNGYDDLITYYYGATSKLITIYLKDKTGYIGSFTAFDNISHIAYNEDGTLSTLVTYRHVCCDHPSETFYVTTFSYESGVKCSTEIYEIVSGGRNGFKMPYKLPLYEDYRITEEKQKITCKPEKGNYYGYFWLKEGKDVKILHKKEVDGEMWAFVAYKTRQKNDRMGWIQMTSK